MALNAYLKLVAARQGQVVGSVLQKGREGTIMVVAVSQSIVSPRHPVSGKPTGKRMHKPLVLTKEIDRASPILYTILCSNENIRSVELDFYRPDRAGIERKCFQIQLTNATLSAMHLWVPNNRNPRTAMLPEREEIAFTYQKISWTWIEGGISAEDDWLTPR
jgi:type VI secretion system secreted protein Hcp